MSEELVTSSSSSSPFSIEMVANPSNDEKSLSVLSKQSSLLEDVQDEDDDDEGPELVPVESSDSETDNKDSVAPEDDEKNHCDAMVTNNDDVGMIDCLSDQFSNLFCTVAPPELCVARNDAFIKERSACQVFNAADPSTDVFSHLQFWWSPSQEEKLKYNRKPQNRSNQPRQKCRHIKNLLDNWHPTPEHTLVRSKSIIDGKRPRFPGKAPDPDGYYDSDPEEAYKKKERGETLTEAPEKYGNYKDKRPRPINAICETHAVSYDDEFKPHPPAPRNQPRRSFKFGRDPRDRSPTSLHEYDLMHPANDHYIRQFVQEVQNTRLKLIWHRYIDDEESKTDSGSGLRAPRAVMATFEVGTHLDQKVVQPKLSWSSANTNTGEKRISSQSDSDWIELLSIIRVITPSRLNRKQYPFARTDRTFCIVANDDRNPYLVFEAENPSQRDWFVTALKMTVARLASVIIVKDEGMLLEFFSPYAALVGLGDQEHTDDEEEEEEPMHEDLYEEQGGLNATSDEADEADVALDLNGEMHLMNLSPVLFNPKDL